MGDDGWTDTESQDRRRYQNRNDAQADEYILTDDGSCPPTQTYGEGKVSQVVGHQSDVCGFKCYVGTSGTHCDAHRSVGHGRSVVHPITNHGDLSFRPELLDHPHLVLRQKVTHGLIETNFLGYDIGNLDRKSVV